jgi:multidrug resistance efflux pump
LRQTQEQATAELRRQLEEKMQEINDAITNETDVSASAIAEESQIRASESTLIQSLAELSVHNNTLVVTAPMSGRVAALNIKAGDHASTTVPLFAIVPQSGPLEVEVLVPSEA